MEKKYIRKPFDVEMAKKITNGDIEGRIVNDTGHLVRIICFDARNDNPIVALIVLRGSYTEEVLRDFNLRGINYRHNDYLYLEFPEEEELKPDTDFSDVAKIILNHINKSTGLNLEEGECKSCGRKFYYDASNLKKEEERDCGGYHYSYYAECPYCKEQVLVKYIK